LRDNAGTFHFVTLAGNGLMEDRGDNVVVHGNERASKRRLDSKTL
jgi:hypothetical protein